MFMCLHKSHFLIIVIVTYSFLIHGMWITNLPTDIVEGYIFKNFEPQATAIPEKHNFQFNELRKDVGNVYDEFYNPLKHLCTTLIYFSLVNKKTQEYVIKYLDNPKNALLKECLTFHQTKSIDLFCYPFEKDNTIYDCISQLEFSKEKFCFVDEKYVALPGNRKCKLDQSVNVNKQYNYAFTITINALESCVKMEEMSKKYTQAQGNEIPWNECIKYTNNEKHKKEIKTWEKMLNTYFIIRLKSHFKLEILPAINKYSIKAYLIPIAGFNYESFCNLKNFIKDCQNG